MTAAAPRPHAPAPLPPIPALPPRPIAPPWTHTPSGKLPHRLPTLDAARAAFAWTHTHIIQSPQEHSERLDADAKRYLKDVPKSWAEICAIPRRAEGGMAGNVGGLKLQRAYSIIMKGNLRLRYLDAVQDECTRKTADEVRARILDYATPGGKAPLVAIPSSPLFAFADSEWMIYLTERVGRPPPFRIPGKGGVHCRCAGGKWRLTLDHLYVCKLKPKSAGGNITRHDELVTVIADMYRTAGRAVDTEVIGLAGRGRDGHLHPGRRVDHVIPGAGEAGRDLCTDFTVRSYRAQGARAIAAKGGGTLAKSGEKAKITKWRVPLARGGRDFLPLGIAEFGAFGPGGGLDAAIRKTAEYVGQGWSPMAKGGHVAYVARQWVPYWTQRIAVTIARATARMVIGLARDAGCQPLASGFFVRGEAGAHFASSPEWRLRGGDIVG